MGWNVCECHQFFYTVGKLPDANQADDDFQLVAFQHGRLA